MRRIRRGYQENVGRMLRGRGCSLLPMWVSPHSCWSRGGDSMVNRSPGHGHKAPKLEAHPDTRGTRHGVLLPKWVAASV